MASTAADILLDRLIDWGVDTIFSLPGTDQRALRGVPQRKDKLRFVQVRHEEAAAFAACGYAKYAGRLGVCMATSGPGGIHLLNGLYDAKMDKQPVLAITGHTFHDLIGCHFQQDVDLVKLFQDVAVYNERVMGPAHVVNVRRRGHQDGPRPPRRGPPVHPQGRAGDDHLATPRGRAGTSRGTAATCIADSAPMPADGRPPGARPRSSTPARRSPSWSAAAPSAARAEVEQLAEKAAGPVAKALLGKAVIPDDSPYTTGGLGLLGTAPSQDAMRECDTLVMIGTSFPYVQFLPEPGQAKCVQIDIDPARIGLRHPADVGLAGYCRPILQAPAAAGPAEGGPRASWRRPSSG